MAGLGKKHSVKLHLLVGVVFGLVVLVAGIKVYTVIFPDLGFTYFEPNYVPPGVAIREKRLNFWQPPGLKTEYKSANISFKTSDPTTWVYSIMEWKDDGTVIQPASQNYDGSSQKPTCGFYDSREGQNYRLCHWVDYGRIDVYEVRFRKAGTLIIVLMPAEFGNRVQQKDIDTFVDSFRQKSTVGVPVFRSSGI